ncbi:MAG: type II toxin-antitoxin system HicB family antitoxin [Planctomycetota bacterium]|jgi:predicted RNase H-like HicB family nuclease
MQKYTAVIKNDGEWWYGWIEEVTGVNCQEKSKPDLLATLKETLQEAIKMNREEAINAAAGNFTEESIAV